MKNNEKTAKGTVRRPLFADFRRHAGDDSDFKEELIGLMIDNIEELKRALDLSFGAIDHIRFNGVCHKVNSTLTILADAELSRVVKELKANGDSKEKIAHLTLLCSQVIESLEAARKITDTAAVYS